MMAMLSTLRCRFRNARGQVGCSVIGTSCQQASRYGMRFSGIRRLIRMSWLRGWLSRMLSFGTQADQVQEVESKALPNSETAWHELIRQLRIEGSGAGAAGDQCSVAFVCNNQSTVLLRDMQIPTTHEAEAMAMARRMQHAIRFSAVERKRRSLMAALVINSVRTSRSHN